MPDAKFVDQVQMYLRKAGYSQQNLADELGLHPVVLSRKLRGNMKAHVTRLEIKRILTILAKWGALMTRAEAIQLLELAQVPATLFSAEEWQAPPLSLLEDEPPKQMMQSLPFLTRSPSRPLLHTLPAVMNTLIGREWEIKQLKRLLGEDTVRLLTLLGPGGSGKTRLALQLAHETEVLIPDGSWFVPLSAVHEADLVSMSILQVLGITHPPHLSAAEGLAHFLREKRALLVLDNFEHVLPAATLVSTLLAAAPFLKVMLTSREALRIYGEREFFVPPLDLPDVRNVPDHLQLQHYGAIQLFVERVRATMPNFTLTDSNGAAIAQICAHLDGLPLALELAAARMRSMSPTQLLTQLKSGMLPILTRGTRNAPDRHQTMRKTIAWSYDLLQIEEQVYFRRLSVFVGGWTLEAAAAVCSEPEDVLPPELATLERLDSLLEKSLVYRQDIGRPTEFGAGVDEKPRFGVLETIREYAQEQLEANGERDTLERAHAYYFLALAEEAEPHLGGEQMGMWLDLLDREYSNLQAALTWLHNHVEHDRALRMAAALWPFWDQRGHYIEGRRWLEKLLEVAGETDQSNGEMSQLNRKVRAKVMIGASGLAWDQQDLEQAAILAEEALAIVRADGNLHWTADVLADLGMVSLDRGVFDQAVAYLAECLALTQQIGDETRFAAAQLTLSLVKLAQGELEQSRALAEESLTLEKRHGNKRGQILCLHALSAVSLFSGDLSYGRTLNREALLIAEETGYVLGLAVGLAVLAGAAALEGRGEIVARLVGAEEALLERSEGRLPAAMQRMLDQIVQPTREELGEEVWARANILGRVSSLYETLALAAIDDTGTNESFCVPDA